MIFAYRVYVAQIPKHAVTPYSIRGLTNSLVMTYTVVNAPVPVVVND